MALIHFRRAAVTLQFSPKDLQTVDETWRWRASLLIIPFSVHVCSLKGKLLCSDSIVARSLWQFWQNLNPSLTPDPDSEVWCESLTDRLRCFVTLRTPTRVSRSCVRRCSLTPAGHAPRPSAPPTGPLPSVWIPEKLSNQFCFSFHNFHRNNQAVNACPIKTQISSSSA